MATKNYGVMRPHKNDGVMLLSHVMTEDEAARKVDRLNRIVQDDDYFQIVALPAEDDAEKLARVQRLCRALGVAVPQRLPPPTSERSHYPAAGELQQERAEGVCHHPQALTHPAPERRGG